MIPQHCRQGREQGTVLIREALLSGKILKGMQTIVVNFVGPHSNPSAAGMFYWSWSGVYLRFIIHILFLFYGTYHVSNVTSSYVDIAWWRISDVVVHIQSWLNKCGFHAFTHKCEFKRQFTFLDSFQCPLTSWKHVLSQVDWLFMTIVRRRRWRGRWQHESRCWWEG